jgi:hypothetical protein
VYASSFAHPAVRTQYRASFAVRARPDAPRSRAAVGINNRGMHAEMLAAHGIAMDEARFESMVGSTYHDFYRLLLERATEAGLRLPPLVVNGHAVPDLQLDATPGTRVMGEFEGLVSTFAVVDETSLVAVLALHSAMVAARSQRYDAFAVLLADRADLVATSSGPESERIDELGILVRFDLADGSGDGSDGDADDGAPCRVRWRSGLASQEALVAAAEELAASANGPIVVSAALAALWEGLGDRALVAPANRPATGLFDVALDQAGGREVLLIGFDPDRRQLAAVPFRVPEVIL